MESLVMNYSDDEDEDDILPSASSPNGPNIEFSDSYCFDPNLKIEDTRLTENVPEPQETSEYILGEFSSIPIAASCDSTELDNFNNDGLDKELNDDVIMLSNEEDPSPETFSNDCISSIVISRVETVTEDLHGAPASNPEIVRLSMGEVNLSKTTSLVSHEASDQIGLSTESTTQEKVTFTCDMCTFSANTRFSLARHQSGHNLKSANMEFKCDLCKFSGNTRFSLARHQSWHNQSSANRKFKCDLCTFSGNTRFSLARHQSRHYQSTTNKENSTESSKNPVNSEKSLEPNKLVKLKTSGNKQVTKFKIFKCQHCSFSSKIRFALQRHILTHNSETHNSTVLPNLDCNICSFKGKSKLSLIWHLIRAHKRNSSVCARCSKIVPKQMKNEHLLRCKKKQLSISKNAFKCDNCSYTTRQQKRFLRHEKICPNKLYSDSDEHSKSSSSDSDNHEPGDKSVESSLRKLRSCKFCSFTTYNINSMTGHLVLHTVYNRPIFCCTQCDYKSTKINMTKHFKTHHKAKSSTKLPRSNRKIQFDKTPKKISSQSSESEPDGVEKFKENVPKVKISETQLDESREDHKKAFACNENGRVKPINRILHKCEFCSFTSLYTAVLCNHVKLHTELNRPIYGCSKCDYKSTKKNLLVHFRVTHGKQGDLDQVSITSKNAQKGPIEPVEVGELGNTDTFSCEFCSYGTNRQGQLRKHVILHTKFNKPIYSCSQCDYKSFESNLRFHKWVVHGQKNTVKEGKLGNTDRFSCEFCSYRTNVRYHLSRHVTAHTMFNKPIYSCNLCDYKSVKASLAWHKWVVHRDKKYISAVKPTKMATRPSLQSKNLNTGIYLQKNTVELGEADQVNITCKNAVTGHIEPVEVEQLDNTDTFSCEFCSYTTNTKPHLRCHLELHTKFNSLLYSCKYCDYKSTKSIVAKHETYFHLKGNNQVDNCQNKPNLYRHRLKHKLHKSPIYSCSKCNFKATKTGLAMHLRVAHETDVSEYSCKYCSYSTRKKGNLTTHLLLHTVQKKPVHQCNKCDFRAMQKSMQMHSYHAHGVQWVSETKISTMQLVKEPASRTKQIKVTSEDLPLYRCKHCSHSTKTHLSFKTHLLLHTVHKKPVYQCNKCDYRLMQKSMEKHSIQAHGVQWVRGTKMSAMQLVKEPASRTKKIKVTSEDLPLYRCKHCSHSTKTHLSFKTHLLLHTVHKKPVYQCNKCDCRLMQKSMEKHSIQAHGVQWVRGTKMSAMQLVKEPASRTKKIKVTSEDLPLYRCKHCSHSTKTHLSFKTHLLLHTVHKKPVYQCNKCDCRLMQKSMEKHSIQAHGVQWVRGTKMSAMQLVKEPASRTKKIKVTSEDLPLYRCKHCSHSTKTHLSFKTHLLLHTVHKKPVYQCNKCDCRLMQKSMEKHSIQAHGVQWVRGTKIAAMKFVKEPGSRTKRINAISKDLLVYRCKHCSLSTNKLGNLKTHLLFHTVEKLPVYQCDKCDFRGLQKNMEKHSVRVHGVRFRKTINIESDHFAKKRPETSKEIVRSVKSKVNNTSSGSSPDSVTDSTLLGQNNRLSNSSAGPSNVFFVCEICEYVTNSKATLISHKLTHSKAKLPSDAQTKKSSESSLNNSSKREGIRVNGKTIMCNKCPRYFPTSAGFSNHKCIKKSKNYTSHIDANKVTYRCRSCSYESSIQANVKNHCQKNHFVSSDDDSDEEEENTRKKNVIYKCDTCDFQTSLEDKLQNHQVLHININELRVYKNKTYNVKLNERKECTSESSGTDYYDNVVLKQEKNGKRAH